MQTRRSSNFRTVRLAAVAGLVISSVVGAAEPAGAKPKAPQARPAPSESRARWAALPAEKRRELQALYERLRRLSPEERRSLVEKLRALDPPSRKKVLEDARTRAARKPVERQAQDLRRELLRSRVKDLAPAERERLEGMSAEERARYFESLVRDRRERLLDQVPPEDRARVRAMPPREQAQYLSRLRGQRILRATFPDPRDVRAVRKLPPARVAAMLRAGKAATDRPAPGVSAEGWKRWLELKPYERTRVLGIILGPAKAPGAPKAPKAPSEPKPG